MTVVFETVQALFVNQTRVVKNYPVMKTKEVCPFVLVDYVGTQQFDDNEGCDLLTPKTGSSMPIPVVLYSKTKMLKVLNTVKRIALNKTEL